jgi:putative lipoprotein/thioderoxin
MKKGLILTLIAFASAFVCKAQEGYQISGKINGLPDCLLFLVTEESGTFDTLATTRCTGGAFVLTGKVNAPVAAYIVATGQEIMIPLILENTTFMLNVSGNRALIKGGEQQEVFTRFNKLNMDLLRAQELIQQEYRQAERANDRKQLEALNTRLEEAIVEARQKEEKLLKQYANTYVAAYVVAAGAPRLELDALRERYALLGDEAKNTVPGRSVAELISTRENIKEGNVAPDFTVYSLQGDSLSLHLVKGKLKLLHFWGSDDPVCRRDNVNILNLYQRFHLKGLEIVSVSRNENEQAWTKAINTDGMFWKNGLDQEARVFHLYGVKALPYTILLDEENRIIAKNLENKVLQKKIKELLKKK